LQQAAHQRAPGEEKVFASGKNGWTIMEFMV
jgi:hypothetical protein